MSRDAQKNLFYGARVMLKVMADSDRGGADSQRTHAEPGISYDCLVF